MGLFKKKADPISDRSRTLKAEIAALEEQIKSLNSTVEQAKTQPRLRSTARPQAQQAAPTPAARPAEPIFEPVDHTTKAEPPEEEATPDIYNDLGVRKYDMVAVWKRIQNHFRGPTANNPKLVSYLAAGSIKGLRPLRYEKRVARNRFIALFVVLVLMLLGLISAFVRHY